MRLKSAGLSSVQLSRGIRMLFCVEIDTERSIFSKLFLLNEVARLPESEFAELRLL